MNAKKAKALRRQAQAQSIGQSEARWWDKKTKRPIPGGSIKLMGAGIPTIELVPGCTRAKYQTLKRVER